MGRGRLPRLYECALGGDIYPMSSFCSERTLPSEQVDGLERNAHLTLGMGYPQSRLDYPFGLMHSCKWDHPSVYAPDLSLLGLNSRICAKGLYDAWALMCSCFICRGVFHCAVAAQPGSASLFKYLGKVELNFTNCGYFQILRLWDGWELFEH